MFLAVADTRQCHEQGAGHHFDRHPPGLPALSCNSAVGRAQCHPCCMGLRGNGSAGLWSYSVRILLPVLLSHVEWLDGFQNSKSKQWRVLGFTYPSREHSYTARSSRRRRSPDMGLGACCQCLTISTKDCWAEKDTESTICNADWVLRYLGRESTELRGKT